MITPKDDEGERNTQDKQTPDSDVMAASGGGTSGDASDVNDDYSNASDSDSELLDFAGEGAVGGVSLNKRYTARDDLHCEEHSGERISAYCETCDTALCFKCWTDPKHASHEVTSFKDWLEKTQGANQTRGSSKGILKRAQLKQQKLKQLRNSVQSGHKRETETARSKARMVLTSLKMKFDREVQRLEDTLEKQTRLVKKMLQEKIEKIRTSSEQQLRRVDEAQKKVDDIVDGLQRTSAQASGSVTHEKEQQLADDIALDQTVPDLNTIDVVSGQLQLEDFTPLDDFPAMVKMKTDLDNAAVPSSTCSSCAASSTSKGAVAGSSEPCAVIPADRVPFLKTRIASLTPQDVTSHNGGSTGKVVITRDYHIDCRQFAEGKTNIFPGSLQCPDLRKPYSWRNDVTFLPPGDAAALCTVVGGKPAVTVGDNCSWLDDHNMMFRLTYLYDEQAKALVIPGKSSDSHYCNLPVRETFHNAIEKYAGFYPSVVKEKSSGNVIDHTVTVGAWKDGPDYIHVIVIK